jgi:hypothetical protein
MPRELKFRPGECDSCRHFQAEASSKHKISDIGICQHPHPPQNTRTTRGLKLIPVRAASRRVSSGMTCDNWEEREGPA